MLVTKIHNKCTLFVIKWDVLYCYPTGLEGKDGNVLILKEPSTSYDALL